MSLVRLLYAQSLLTNPTLVLGRFAPLGPVLADPRRRVANAFLSLHNVLPNRYPLGDLTVADIVNAESWVGRLLDYGMILPRVTDLYSYASAELNYPRLLTLVPDGFPVYAWPFAHRNDWIREKGSVAPRLFRRRGFRIGDV